MGEYIRIPVYTGLTSDGVVVDVFKRQPDIYVKRSDVRRLVAEEIAAWQKRALEAEQKVRRGG